MVIQLVILDGDGVLWDHPDLSALVLPFKRVSQDVIVDSMGEKVRLTREMRNLLKELVKRGIVVALATWNKPTHVTQALQLLDIDTYFRVVESKFHPRKHIMIRNILKKLAEEGFKLKSDQILYVDDRRVHLADIRKEIGNIHFLQMHVDIKKPSEILKYIDDPTSFNQHTTIRE